MAGGTRSPPICRAALRMVVPGSTSVLTPSMVILYFSDMLLLFNHSRLPAAADPLSSGLSGLDRQGIGITGQPVIPFLAKAGYPDVPFKFVPEMPDGASHGPGRRIAQGTDRVPFDFGCHIHQQIDVAHFAVPVFDPMQHFLHPSGSFPAGAALAAGFVMVKTGEIPGVPDNTGILVHYDESARPQHGT